MAEVSLRQLHSEEISPEDLLLSYDLQFFGDEGGDKTEEPTDKKLEDTRKKGSVAKSQELANGIELVGMFLMLRIFTSYMAEKFIGVFDWVYGTEIVDIVNTERSGITINTVSGILQESLLQVLIIGLPFYAGGFLIALLSNALQFKFKVTTEPLKPKLSKFNPINGFKRIFSKRSLVNLLLAIVKIAVIFAVAYSCLKDRINELFLLYDLPLNQGIALVGDIVLDTGLKISMVYVIVGFADFVYQKWKFKEEIKMTKQEVKDEYKNSEGDPQIKGRQKQRMREASQRRMMSAVPQADVVITNPTHIAVAIKYDTEIASAPVVLAKGEDYLAQRIKTAAKDNNVDIVENKPLARAIYTTVDVGAQIPPELYQAVAEILAVIYNRKNRR